MENAFKSGLFMPVDPISVLNPLESVGLDVGRGHVVTLGGVDGAEEILSSRSFPDVSSWRRQHRLFNR